MFLTHYHRIHFISLIHNLKKQSKFFLLSLKLFLTLQNYLKSSYCLLKFFTSKGSNLCQQNRFYQLHVESIVPQIPEKHLLDSPLNRQQPLLFNLLKTKKVLLMIKLKKLEHYMSQTWFCTFFLNLSTYFQLVQSIKLDAGKDQFSFHCKMRDPINILCCPNHK